MQLHWHAKIERMARQLPRNSKKSNKIKSQKTEQDSLLNVALHSESGFLYFHDSVCSICATEMARLYDNIKTDYAQTKWTWGKKESHMGRSGL
jgi:hypothetical protein